MFGVGATEFLVIAIVLALLLGAPALFGYWLGYQAGKRAEDAAAPRHESVVEDEKQSNEEDSADV